MSPCVGSRQAYTRARLDATNQADFGEGLLGRVYPQRRNAAHEVNFRAIQKSSQHDIMAKSRKKAQTQPVAANAGAKKNLEPARAFQPPNTSLWMHVGILALLSLAVYFPTVGNNFVTDDKMQILQNPQVKDPQNWAQAFQGDVWAFAEGSNKDRIRGSNYYRPLQILTYEAEYATFAERPAGWHFFNAVVNAAVVCLVYLLVVALASPAVAFWAGLFFALHPMHTETVAWIAALPELQCAFFLLLAMIFYHRARSGGPARSFVGLSTVFFFCALLSKETALLFPIILLAYEFLYRRKSPGELREWAPWLGPSLAVLVIYIAARIAALGGFSPHAESPRGILSPSELLVAIPPVFARYLGKLLLPVGMNYFYAFPLEKHFSALVLASMIVLACFVWAAPRQMAAAGFCACLAAADANPGVEFEFHWGEFFHGTLSVCSVDWILYLRRLAGSATLAASEKHRDETCFCSVRGISFRFLRRADRETHSGVS